MSTQQKPNYAIDGITEEEVIHYLIEHPTIFESHTDLLAGLELQHESTGNTISLIERQVQILRQQNQKLERKLVDLVDVARSNDELSVKIHRLAVRLIEASSLAGAVEIIEESLRTDFGADESVLVLFDVELSQNGLEETGFLRAAERESVDLKTFETFFANDVPRCGHLRDAQRNFLFGEDSVEVGSAALVPIGRNAARGILAIGARDSHHFNPAMGTEYLQRVGEILDAFVDSYDRK